MRKSAQKSHPAWWGFELSPVCVVYTERCREAEGLKSWGLNRIRWPAMQVSPQSQYLKGKQNRLRGGHQVQREPRSLDMFVGMRQVPGEAAGQDEIWKGSDTVQTGP